MGWEDDRGVSEVLGAILLFGIIVLAIGGYQSLVVPQQNAEIEHEHDRSVNDEFVEIQTAISNAAASGKQRTASITLGTDYPSRVFSMNIPPASGSLKTGPSGKIQVKADGDLDIANTCGLDPETRSIRYRANYNELGVTGELVYEHGVTFRKVDGRTLPQTDQELIDGDTIFLQPITNGEFHRTSSSKERLRFVPGRTGVRTIDTEGEPLQITFPEISEEVWNDVKEEQESIRSVNSDTITLEPGRYTVHCTPIGIGSKPEQSHVPNEHPGPEDVANQINPNRQDEIVLVNTSTVGNNGESNVSIYLEDRTDSEEVLEIVGARLNFYGGSSPGYSPEKDSFLTLGGEGFGPGGEFKGFDEENYISINEDPTQVPLEFSENVDGDDFYVLTLEYSNGKVSVYFVSHQGGPQNS